MKPQMAFLGLPTDTATLQATGMSTHFKEEYITDTESGSSEEASGSEEDVASWISWFCSLKGNEFFCEIEEDYIQDDFNLSGLCSQVNTYRMVLLTRFGAYWIRHE